MGSMKKASILLFLLLSFCLIASEEMVAVEGRTCESTRTEFMPACLKRGCVSLCQGEGFTDGDCDGGLIGVCRCHKPC